MQNETLKIKEYRFPKNFLWGVAISSYQTEGYNFYADWYSWEKLGKIKDGSISGQACDFYHRYQEDIDLAQSLNFNAFRLSLEWSRIEPEEGKFNEKEIDYYRKVLSYLKEKKFKIFLTLWHFSLPYWLARKGGWQNTASVSYFLRFVKKIVPEFSKFVDFWLTLNEPLIYIGCAYFLGLWPPEKKNFFTALKVFFNLIKAHQKSYQIIHHILPQAKVGLANNLVYFRSMRRNFFDQVLAKILNYFYNHFFYRLTKNHHDFIGLNYYTCHRVEFLRIKDLLKRMTSENPETRVIRKEIHPEGLYFLLKDLKKFKLPIYITENGLADAGDLRRRRFILRHLKYLWQAIQEGVDVRGYLHWSLIDNFEWREGFKPRFGLVEIDYESLTRRPRKSAYLFQEICQRNALTFEIVEKYDPERMKEIFF
ncbi:MAG: glycoside hydrolase family 1 protein [Patescibacteria group bacterium]|nr:glycoside hydrolase family 1 protein [Patescibacteria group bacterium]